MKACAAVLTTMDGGEVRAKVLSGGLTVELPSGPVTLGPAEIVTAVEPLPGFQATGSASAVVALHAALDEDLLEEGLAREVISRVQAVRKGWGIAYEAQVRIAVEGGARTGRMVGRFGAQIEEATVSTLGPATADGERVDVSVDGEDLVIVASRA
jgi:isoleucyl-tRNA synthetase